MKIAFVYSGQGAQYLGMGQEFYETFPTYRSIIDQGSAILGYDLQDLMVNQEAKLNETVYTQPAILAMSVALTAVLKEELNLEPTAVAGLSLGEYSALIASQALSYEEGIALVEKRGRFMTEAVPAGVGAMSAVMGLSREVVEATCAEASSKGLVIAANYNMPTQIAIAGEVAAVAYAEELLTAKGARRVIRLNVSGPFHTALLKPAADQLAVALGETTFSEMQLPVVTNVTGQVIPSQAEIVPTLVKQVMSPVYWQDCVETLIADGYDTFVEVGPGKALSSFIKKINKNVTVQNVDNLKTLEKVKKMIQA
ncbi:ACP S-malonyltransferase [Vagococcus salmoninarum]|uniref:Malonyl CoA-acyl carrier protein transacylase n=1 Tax=Vagococcus salmoninarum TaxID=2739 RepID=A0A429ZC08_9ENTE|nr:ACP S-malonyltransferase [Vagococcus salmoninarum]MBE9388662.1 ACP S-malonyltransferase [Vagococcus salmoninarum]RST91232.1 [acyl-carrier-protein] S-malonyltransferase [Vagococcus salmoninarum]